LPIPYQGREEGGIKTGGLWVWIGDHDHPYTVSTDPPDPSAAGLREIFKDSRGYLQADASSANDGLYGVPVDSMKAGEPFGGKTCVGDTLAPLRSTVTVHR
jgi:hypothetical protein